MTPPTLRFPATAGGEIAAGRRRLATFLLTLTAAMLVVAVGAWLSERPAAGILAALVALLPWTAWRMSRDLDLFWLELVDGRLVVQLKRQRVDMPTAGARARRLTTPEIAHLERLAGSGGVTAGSGGFDSSLLGEIDLYAANLENAVLVESGEDRLVLTPDDPEEFLEALRRVAT